MKRRKLFQRTTILLVFMGVFSLWSCKEEDWGSEIRDLQSDIDSLQHEINIQNAVVDSIILLLDSADFGAYTIYELGKTTGGFIVGETYQVDNDGFLTIHNVGTVLDSGVKLYVDSCSLLQNVIGEMCSVGISTFPIKAGYYFKAEKMGKYNELSIYYTPLLISIKE